MSSPAVVSFHFDTDDFPAHARFETWREVIAATHDLALVEPDPTPFHMNFRILDLDSMMISSGQFSAQGYSRTRENLRRDHLDHYAVFVQGEGTRYTLTGGEEYLLRPRDIQILDFAQADMSRASAGNSCTLYLPRDMVDEVIPHFSSLHGMVASDALGPLLARHLQTVNQQLPHLSAAALPHLIQATKDLVLAVLVSMAGGGLEMNSAVEGALRRQVERYIDAHLTDPGLCADSICAAFPISRSTLYRLFRIHAGVAGFIKERRLLLVRSILIAGNDPRPLMDIALDYGFSTGAHFSREFRAAFGYPPSDVRASRHHAAPDSDQPGARADIDQMFRMLHP